MNHSWSAALKIGFLGAGQLARMSALEAAKFGFQIHSFSDRKDQLEPLEQVCPNHFKGSFDSLDDLIDFAHQCDVLTLENEFIDSKLLRDMVQKSGKALYPSPKTFEAIENKFIEKKTYSDAGIPVCPFALVQTVEQMSGFGEDYGWPYLLKSSKGGYDGYGNETVNTIEEAIVAFNKLGGQKGHDILAEAFVPFEMELAVTVARSETEAVVYPCVQSIQENHICKKVICPAPVHEDIQLKAQHYAQKAMESIDAIGVFSFEFFLTKDGEILLNESAPRPHNSAHYTIEACVTSQFENHIRAILNMPLGSTALRKPAAVMINLLGTQNGEAELKNYEKAAKEEDGHLHIYGKTTSKVGRKMGHYTLLGENAEQSFEKALELTNDIEI